MKKLRYLFAIVVLVFISTACGQSDGSTSSSTGMATVEDIISAQMAAEDSGEDASSSTAADSTSSSQAAESESEAEDTTTSEDAFAADVDLTDASATIVYGEIYSMVTTPMLYHGKTIKLTGFYDEYFDVMTDTLYCSVFVMDALACCAQGLQIEFSDSYAYPDDYPDDGSEITIFATFEIYYPDPDSNVFFYHLTDTVLVA